MLLLPALFLLLCHVHMNLNISSSWLHWSSTQYCQFSTGKRFHQMRSTPSNLKVTNISFKCSYFPMCLPQPVSISRFLFKASSRLECANPPPLIALDPLFSKFCAVRSRASQWKRRPQFQLPNCCSKPPPLFWVSKSAPAESETLTPLFWNLHAVHRMTHPRNHPPAPFTASKPPPLFWVFKPSPSDHSRPFVFSNFHSVSRMASPQKRPPASRDKAGVSLSWCPPGL